MPGHKRLQETSSSQKSKKAKLSEDGKASKNTPDKQVRSTSNLVSQEVDFPRGGGTSFTPLEVKTIRAEAIKEANEELFDVITSILNV